MNGAPIEHGCGHRRIVGEGRVPFFAAQHSTVKPLIIDEAVICNHCLDHADAPYQLQIKSAAETKRVFIPARVAL